MPSTSRLEPADGEATSRGGDATSRGGDTADEFVPAPIALPIAAPVSTPSTPAETADDAGPRTRPLGRSSGESGVAGRDPTAAFGSSPPVPAVGFVRPSLRRPAISPVGGLARPEGGVSGGVGNDGCAEAVEGRGGEEAPGLRAAHGGSPAEADGAMSGGVAAVAPRLPPSCDAIREGAEACETERVSDGCETDAKRMRNGCETERVSEVSEP